MVVAAYVVLNNNDNVVMSNGYFISMYLLQSCCLISTNVMKDECKIDRGGLFLILFPNLYMSNNTSIDAVPHCL